MIAFHLLIRSQVLIHLLADLLIQLPFINLNILVVYLNFYKFFNFLIITFQSIFIFMPHSFIHSFIL